MILRGYLIVYSVVGLALLATCNAISKEPTVLIGVLVRNKAHTLPYFLSLLERQDYPKKRISLWIRSDNNVDNSIKILNKWISTRREMYHSLNVDLNASSTGFEDEKSIANWSPRRFAHVIDLREQALDYAREIWTDFIWMLDADCFLTNPSTIRNLVHKGHTVVAPLLRSDGMYSNFWAGMTAEHYYLRTELYEPILFREKIGCHDVPMIHSAVFIDLRRRYSDRLTYKAEKLTGYDGPVDDIITFAIGANKSDVPLFVCNDDVYGFVMVPLENDETIAEDMQRLTNTKVEILSFSDYLPLSDDLKEFVMYPEKDTLGLDDIYMINLLRRPERRKRMQRLFEELGIRAEIIDAVDGRLKQWAVACRREDLLEKTPEQVYSSYRICSDHFEDRMYSNNLKNCLLPLAKPTLNLGENLENDQNNVDFEREFPKGMGRDTDVRILRSLSQKTDDDGRDWLLSQSLRCMAEGTGAQLQKRYGIRG
ncbi:glycosyltransferase 25 family member isoform X2 [Temnothorax americanus]|uniref:glycosyltransferase 25 family member isoform X2 n=1 Tax=Temnothorax americanus TaxID=1964332 RepID=UPI0040697072